MTRICAWCGKKLGDKPGGGGSTHTICDECLKETKDKNMTESTLHAMDVCYRTFDKIKAGDMPETDLTKIFLDLSLIDFRTEYEKKVQNYINTFIQGAMIIKDVEVRTASNSDKTYKKQDIEYHCKLFIAEHWKHVQQEFWPKYKDEYKRVGYNNRYAVAPSTILLFIKRIKSDNKRNTDKT